MTAIQSAKTNRVPRKAILDIVRPLTDRPVLLVAILIVVALAGVAALNWRWLVVVGAAPVLVSTLPCLLMCGLGLCMHKFAGRTGANPMDASSATSGSNDGPTAQRPAGGAADCCPGGDPRFGEERAIQSREKINA